MPALLQVEHRVAFHHEVFRHQMRDDGLQPQPGWGADGESAVRVGQQRVGIDHDVGPAGSLMPSHQPCSTTQDKIIPGDFSPPKQATR